MSTKQIKRIVRDVPGHWVGDGFPVRSLFTYAEADLFDPFLLLDYAAPHTFAPSSGEPRGVGEHPHRGFETVTIVYQGELEHRDSAGHHGAIGPGDVQWMTAASGVVHEEFHSQRFARAGGTFEVVQLWVNLPARDKMSAPRYQEILDRQIPVVKLPDGAGSVRVIAGELAGTKGPALTFTPVQLWDVQLSAGGAATLPLVDNHTTALVVQRGDSTVNDTETVADASLVLFDRAGDQISLKAKGEGRVLLLSGQPIGEPVVGQGPFVMNTRDEIQQAIRDFQAGRMGRLA
ncbi:MAG: pirin family protein [Planctomycetia bacterium]|nr:pirin family protein [Planctomycetia bacterium]